MSKHLGRFTSRPGVAPVPARHVFTGANVWQLLEQQAASRSSHPFLTWQPFEAEAQVLTFSELAHQAAQVAAGLSARGVKQGDPVIIHLDNCVEFLVSWFACAAIGAVAVTTNTRSSADELEFLAGHSGAVGAITQPRLAELVSKSATDLAWVVSTDHDAGVPCDDRNAPDGDSAFSSLFGDAASLRPVDPDPMAAMSVQYTSGTTARPKGVVWTHANALWGARQNATRQDLHPSDCHLAYMPLFHTNSLAFSMLASLWVGSRIVLLPKWSTSRFWDISLQHGCTWLSLIGPAIQTLLTTETPGGHSYRMFGTGMCDMPWPGSLEGIKTIGWWGMTETISTPIVGDPFLPNRPMSMGRPAPDYGIAVVREDGSDVEPGETGELLVTGIPGLSLFAEYLFDPAATEAAFDDQGRFRTGDLVTPHEDGHISYADRSKDMLKVGGENVAASEVERVVYSVPGVREVAVVSRRDARLDEVAVAFVVADDPAGHIPEQAVAACRELLADFKVPREVYVVAELPRSLLRKVDKAELRRFADPDADRASAEKRWLQEAAVDPSGDASS